MKRPKDVFEQLNQMMDVNELDSLLSTRERLRRVYAALQDMAMASNNPLFVQYMDIVRKAGDSVNAQIQTWADSVQTLYADTDGGPLEY